MNPHRVRLSHGAACAALFLAGPAFAGDPPKTAQVSAETRTEASVPAIPPPPATSDGKNEIPATSRWQTSFYGFVEFDGMYDTTQSFSDSPGNTPILRSDGSYPAYMPLGTDPIVGAMYGSTHGRTQATARNTRFGFKVSPPDFAGMKVTGVLELDLFGNQPSAPPQTSEGSFFTSPTLRLRHAYAKVEAGGVEVLFGQYYDLFGWQPYFFPGTLSFLGTPNMIFGRTPQVRLSKTIKTDPLTVEIAAAATRPPQRDGNFPGLQGGIRFDVNGWKGAHGRGSGQTMIDPMSIGASAAMRKFRVSEYRNNRGDPTQTVDVAEASGYGVSIDALIPVIPARSENDKSFALTVTGSWVPKGAGIADLYTGGLTGGAQFPLPEGPGGPQTGFYAGNIDPGIVQFDAEGNLRVIEWNTAMVGAQLFLPPSGKVVLTGNYTRAKSENIAQTKEEGGDPSRTFRLAEYYDANLFVDVTPAIRAAFSFQLIRQRYVDNGTEKNQRFEIGGLFFF